VSQKGRVNSLREHLFLVRERPVLLYRLAKNYARLLLWRRPLLRGVEFAITYRCQAKCRHCLRLSLIDRKRKELVPAEIREVVRQLLDLGALNINLTGGEPLLREDLPEVVRLAFPERCFLTLATNGLALTLPLARELRRAGIRMLSLSLDAPGAEEHDRIRGRLGTYRGAMEALEIAGRAGLRVSVCTIVTRELLRSGGVERILADIRGKAQQLTLNMPYRVGGWADEEESLNAAELARFRALTRLPGVRWEGSSNYFEEGCPAGGEKIYLTPYGDVMPCACIHASYGNVRERPLREIYAEMRETPIFRKGVRPACLVAEHPVFAERYLDEINRLAREEPSGARARRLLRRIDPQDFSLSPDQG